MHGLKVVNITEFLILILKVVRLIVTIVSISIIEELKRCSLVKSLKNTIFRLPVCNLLKKK